MKRALVVLLGIIVLAPATTLSSEVCGDVDNNNQLDILDLDYLVNYLFSGGAQPDCTIQTLPTFTSTPVTTGLYGELYTYDADADGEPAPTYSLTTFPAGMTIDGVTGIIEWTPDDIGDFDVVVEATNLVGTTPQSFTITVPFSGTVTDIDGNVYQTVMIGGKEWMAENLKVTHYRNGDAIPNVADDAAWAALDSSGAYCEYNNDINNVAAYGRLYNWWTVEDSRSVAPAGWHVPSDEEWKLMEMSLGMSAEEAWAGDWRGTDEGGKLKETGTTHWLDPNTGATNESWFTALPGGYRSYSSHFSYMDSSAFFWSSTESNVYAAWYRQLNYLYSSIDRNAIDKNWGFSIRCVRD